MTTETIQKGTRCQNFSILGKPRCNREATVRLYSPGDERPVPGCLYCLECAQATQSEYAEKLGEFWTYRSAAFAEGRVAR